MRKFFYRLTFQSVIKGVLVAAISLVCTALVYTIFTSILQPVSANFDYWMQTVVAFIVSAVACFMIIEVKDDYTSADTYSYAVGGFFAERASKRKKVPFLTVELMMLPLLVIAIFLAYLFYRDHATVLAAYATSYSVAEISKGTAQHLFYDNLLHFSKLILAVFFFAQWRHLREFAKKGRCPHCKAAFSLGFHQMGDTRATNKSNVTKKGKTSVVGANYQVVEEDGEEVEKTKVSDVYGTTYSYYQTNTQTTYRSSVCHCAICGGFSTQTDVHVNATTTKTP